MIASQIKLAAATLLYYYLTFYSSASPKHSPCQIDFMIFQSVKSTAGIVLSCDWVQPPPPPPLSLHSPSYLFIFLLSVKQSRRCPCIYVVRRQQKMYDLFECYISFTFQPVGNTAPVKSMSIQTASGGNNYESR
jgi:hypothetical protein